jgi:hypothetical protein
MSDRRPFWQELLLAVGAPIAAEVFGAIREHRRAEHEEYMSHRVAMREAYRGVSEPEKVML